MDDERINVFRLVGYESKAPEAPPLIYPVRAAVSRRMEDDTMSHTCILDDHVIRVWPIYERSRGPGIYALRSALRPPAEMNGEQSRKLCKEFQVAHLRHQSDDVFSIKMDPWRGCVYVTVESEGPIVHVYDFVDPRPS